jgi:glucan phosphoethanolaminetransferase (alkaline phosphatase superfamily)
MRPALRSVPLVIRHPETPSAMMKRGATLAAMFIRFLLAKNPAFVNPTYSVRMTRKMTIALLLMKLFSFLESIVVFSYPRYMYCAASAMIFSCVASLPSTKPLTLPSHMTMMRSLMPISSGISDEIMMMDFPCFARSAMIV